MSEARQPLRTRRSFVTALSAVAGAVTLPMTRLWAEAPRSRPLPLASTEWDLSWLDTLKGKHRQVFGFGTLQNGVGLSIVKNWLNAHEQVFGLKPPEVNAVVGIANKSFPINAGDALWAKYELGKRYDVTDPETGSPAIRNVFLRAKPDSPGRAVTVEALMARGVIFWQCNNALTGIATAFAEATNQQLDAVKAELIAGLNPGVKLVPAHTMLLGLAQEHGCTYESIGG